MSSAPSFVVLGVLAGDPGIKNSERRQLQDLKNFRAAVYLIPLLMNADS
jgi:hypothetical protein